MHLINTKALDTVFNNFEHLHDDYVELPETKEAGKEMWKLLEDKGLSIMEIENTINCALLENERQGFIYGFRYAVELLIGGIHNESDKH